MNNPLLHRLAGCLAALAFAAACHTSQPASELHLRPPEPPAWLGLDMNFVQFRWEDSSSHRQARYLDPWSGQPVALNDSVVLDIRGIDSAWAAPVGHDTAHWDVALLLSRSGAAQFGTTTATHVGKRLGIVLDGKIVGMPQIRSAMGSRALLVSSVPRNVADSLATRVNDAVSELRLFQRARLQRDSSQRVH